MSKTLVFRIPRQYGLSKWHVLFNTGELVCRRFGGFIANQPPSVVIRGTGHTREVEFKWVEQPDHSMLCGICRGRISRGERVITSDDWARSCMAPPSDTGTQPIVIGRRMTQCPICRTGHQVYVIQVNGGSIEACGICLHNLAVTIGQALPVVDHITPGSTISLNLGEQK